MIMLFTSEMITFLLYTSTNLYHWIFFFFIKNSSRNYWEGYKFKFGREV